MEPRVFLSLPPTFDRFRPCRQRMGMLTVVYLIHAYDVPYATFKRWKADSFVFEPYVPEHKGKSIITDKNGRRKYSTQG
jgi:hypothetical protein